MSAKRWCHREELNLCRRSSQNRVPFRGTVAFVTVARLGDRNRTCGLVVPDHALSLLSYTQISSSTRPELHQRPREPGSRALAARATRRRKTQESNPIPNWGNTAFEAGAAPTAALPSKRFVVSIDLAAVEGVEPHVRSRVRTDRWRG